MWPAARQEIMKVALRVRKVGQHCYKAYWTIKMTTVNKEDLWIRIQEPWNQTVIATKIS